MGVLPRAAQSHTNASVSHVVVLDGQVATGDIQYVMVESQSASAHVWPAGWTVKYNAAAGPGRVSVATRVRQGGDGNPTVTDGGVSTSWSSTAVALKATGTPAPAVYDEQVQANASSANVATPAAGATGGHATVLLLVGCTRGNTLTAQYPFVAVPLDTVDAFAPPAVYLPTFASSIATYTLVQSGASPSVAYVVVLDTTPDDLGYEADRDGEADYVRWEGYNKYPLEQATWGGSVSVT
jgi:hypothetical protein